MSCFDDIYEFADLIALESENRVLTYSALQSDADYIASHLPRRSLVIILCRNNIETVVGYVGFLRNNIVPIMLDAGIDKALLERIVKIYCPNAIYAPVNYDIKGLVLFRYYNYSLFSMGYNDCPHMSKDLALLMTTSGSTGSPKFVKQTYNNISSNIHSIVQYLEINDSEHAITLLPVYYTYGLSIINTHIASGASIYCTEESIFNRKFWDICSKYRITNLAGVPYTYEMLERIHFLDNILPDLRYITQAGGRIEPRLQLKYAKAFRNMGKKFIVMYGATEATARMSYLPAEYSVEKIGSIGKPIPGGRFEIVDERGEKINEPDIEGELVFYGANVSPGYAEKQEDLDLPDERQGKLITGDIAKQDKDGFFYITGRKSRFIKMFGKRVSLTELEELLKSQGWETACIGRDDCLTIYLTSFDTITVKKYVAGMLKVHISSVNVEHIDTIPRNASGKIIYTSLNNL